MTNAVKNVIESLVEFTACVAVGFGIIGIMITIAEVALLF